MATNETIYLLIAYPKKDNSFLNVKTLEKAISKAFPELEYDLYGVPYHGDE